VGTIYGNASRQELAHEGGYSGVFRHGTQLS